MQISASTQAADSDDVVVLHDLGSKQSDSEVSVSNLATALTTCRLDPHAAGKQDTGSQGRPSACEGKDTYCTLAS